MDKINSNNIKEYALQLGFSIVGISKAEFFESAQTKLNKWIEDGYHASMEWIPKRLDERGNIFNYFPEVKSVISVGMNYYTGEKINEKEKGKISNYSWGEDYHIVLKDRC